MIVTLLLGSNLGDSLVLLSRSIEMIGVEVGEVVKKTDVLQNKAWGYESAHDYFNQIVQVQTLLEPIAILDKIESIEKQLGRTKIPCDWRKERLYEDRTIDIDILTCEGVEFENERLKIPHPRMNERDFVQVLLKQL